MPLINYSCECGKSISKFFRDPKDAIISIPCKCGKELKKSLKAPNTSSIITVDNGIQAKKVEVNMELVEDIKNRSTKNFNRDD